MAKKTTTPTVKKPTKTQMFASIKEIPGLTAEQIAFIDHEIEFLAKKNASGGSAKLTPQQEANEVIKTAILDLAKSEPNRLFTISELMKIVPGVPAEMSNQRMAQLVRQLYHNEDETVVMPMIREEVKRKAYFRLNKLMFPELFEGAEV